MQRVREIKSELQKWAEALDNAFKGNSENLVTDVDQATRRVEIACDLLSAELAEIEANVDESELSINYRIR